MLKVLSDKQIHMIKHAWGYDSSEPGYRSHYVTSVGDADMRRLVDLGYFYGPLGKPKSGYGMFHLTEAAFEHLKDLKISEKKHRKTRKDKGIKRGPRCGCEDYDCCPLHGSRP
jgi:hypothetical protein